MKEISLTKGRTTIVDDDMYEYLNQWKWFCSSNGYAGRNIHCNGKLIVILMHREILQPPENLNVDHINQDKLDNRRQNLRICNKSENGINRGKNKNNTTGLKGVTFNKRAQLYVAQIKKNRRGYYLGYFKNPLEASFAYEKKAKELFGEFANAG